MEIFSYAFAALCGLIAGVVLTMRFFTSRIVLERALSRQEAETTFAAERASLTERIAGRDARVMELETAVAAARADAALQAARAADLQAATARLEGERQEQARAFEEKMAVVTQARADLEKAFGALAADALKSNQQQFLQLAEQTMKLYREGAVADLGQRQKAIETLVAPVKESLAKVDAQVQALEQKRQEAYGSIEKHLLMLSENSRRLQTETHTLSTALKSTTVRGRWGEVQLRRVIELSGMQEHCDFETQMHVKSEDGGLRPDVVVHLPGRKQLIIDSKCPLDAYLAATETDDEEKRVALLKAHADAVKKHIDALGSKSYWSQFPATPDFVVLFLPGETFFAAALAANPLLIDVGVEKRVLLASPTTLIALLKSVAYGWSQDKLAENAQLVSNQGKELYERVCKFLDHLEGVGHGLSSALKSYNSAVSNLESRVLPSARRIKELGVTSAAETPELAPIDGDVRALAVRE